jgi:hypothetical protein
MTNKYDGTSAVFAAVPSLALAPLQWFPTFWTIKRKRPINHRGVSTWITRENDVKML